jgi:hypothetical protein
MPDLVGCNRCGYVARRDSFEGARRKCPHCGTGLEDMPVEVARRLAKARRKADQRRSEEAAAAEIGLEAAAL